MAFLMFRKGNVASILDQLARPWPIIGNPLDINSNAFKQVPQLFPHPSRHCLIATRSHSHRTIGPLDQRQRGQGTIGQNTSDIKAVEDFPACRSEHRRRPSLEFDQPW
ncbi:MAG: hypothetical protein KJS91_08190, partial [Planctomycetes bacterium]|nr:hypothetical protein [Planctomycetota bacterium]